jgi:hypothetical protein
VNRDVREVVAAHIQPADAKLMAMLRPAIGRPASGELIRSAITVPTLRIAVLDNGRLVVQHERT